MSPLEVRWGWRVGCLPSSLFLGTNKLIHKDAMRHAIPHSDPLPSSSQFCSFELVELLPCSFLVALGWYLRYDTFCIGKGCLRIGVSGIGSMCLLDAFIPCEFSAILPDMVLEAATMSLAVGAGLSAWCRLLGFLPIPLIMLAVVGVVDNQGVAGAAIVGIELGIVVKAGKHVF